MLMTNNFKDLILVVAKCKTFLSVDTALQHLAANDFQRKRKQTTSQKHG